MKKQFLGCLDAESMGPRENNHLLLLPDLGAFGDMAFFFPQWLKVIGLGLTKRNDHCSGMDWQSG